MGNLILFKSTKRKTKRFIIQISLQIFSTIIFGYPWTQATSCIEPRVDISRKHLPKVKWQVYKKLNEQKTKSWWTYHFFRMSRHTIRFNPKSLSIETMMNVRTGDTTDCFIVHTLCIMINTTIWNQKWLLKRVTRPFPI